MIDRARLASWWETEKARDHTKLECGLLGAAFATIAIFLAIAIRIGIG